MEAFFVGNVAEIGSNKEVIKSSVEKGVEETESKTYYVDILHEYYMVSLKEGNMPYTSIRK